MTGVFKRFHAGASGISAGILLAVLAVAPTASQATTYYDYRFTLRYVDAFYIDAYVTGDGPDGYDLPFGSTLAKSDDIWGFQDPFGLTPGQEWNVRMKAAVADDGSVTVDCINSPIECSGFYGIDWINAYYGASFMENGFFSMCLDMYCDSGIFGRIAREASESSFDYNCGNCYMGGIVDGRQLYNWDYSLRFEVTSVEVVPLPPSALLLMGAAAGLGMVGRRASRKSAARLDTH
ncbi:hypothetical protein ACRDNQ_01315 [Palleronia sp. KMU-117]|uniref:hypothetical protein n=1 Tax=Palleronia sp. KMU-117 TaxID=3434108 RepID=UPI003D729742